MVGDVAYSARAETKLPRWLSVCGLEFPLPEFVMSRIHIEDLPHEETLPDNELRQIFGAGLSERSIQATRNLFANRAHDAKDVEDGLIRQPSGAPRNPFLVDRDSPLS
jgi:hypothetical protein